MEDSVGDMTLGWGTHVATNRVAAAGTSGAIRRAGALPATRGRGAFKAAIIEFEPHHGQKQKNVARLAGEIDDAFSNHARLVVTPEMATTGYHFTSRDEIAPLVETVPGPTTHRLQTIAKRHDGYIVVSLPERDARTEQYFITAALIGPGGVIGKYRKSHLWEPDKQWAEPGDLGLPVFDTPLGRIGMLICMDSVCADTSATLAAQGADLLIMPTNSSAQTVSLLQGLAGLNQLNVIVANRAGSELGMNMLGGSGLSDPSGRVIARTPVNHSEETPARTIYGTLPPRVRPASTLPPPHWLQRRVAGAADPPIEDDLGLAELVAAQFSPSSAPAYNREHIVARLDNVGLSRVKDASRAQDVPPALVTFPELALTGPAADRAMAVKRAAEARAQLHHVQEAAKRNGVATVVGTIEYSDGELFNAAAVIDADGQLVGLHRKSLFGAGDDPWATAGSALDTYDMPGLGRVGVLIGAESRHPLVASAMALGRANILAVSERLRPDDVRKVRLDGLSANDYPLDAGVAWDALARLSQVPTVVANWGGVTVPNGSGVYGVDPIYGLDATITRATGALGQVGHPVDLRGQEAWWFNRERLLALRRPSLYGPQSSAGGD